MSKLPILAVLAASVALAAASPAAAAKPATPPPAALSKADKALMDQAAAYLNGLKSAQARFSQTDPRGAVTGGTFYLQRPGKARFAYDAPTDLTVVADGVNVNVYDGKLKTFDQYPVKQTPLTMLLGTNVKFDQAVVVTGVERTKDGFTVSIKDKKKQADGRLDLNFSTGPMALTGWTVLDAQGLRTTVRLSGLKTGVALDSGLFVLRDPRPAHTFKP